LLEAGDIFGKLEDLLTQIFGVAEGVDEGLGIVFWESWLSALHFPTDEEIVKILKGLLKSGLAVGCCCARTFFASEFVRVPIVSLYAVLRVDLLDVGPVVEVDLSQLFLESSLLFVEVDEVLLDEGLNIDLHVVSRNRVVVLGPNRQRREVAPQLADPFSFLASLCYFLPTARANPALFLYAKIARDCFGHCCFRSAGTSLPFLNHWLLLFEEVTLSISFGLFHAATSRAFLHIIGGIGLLSDGFAFIDFELGLGLRSSWKSLIDCWKVVGRE
jgi:hypothetical protein